MDPSPDPPAPAPQRVTVASSRTRCPYCHDDVHPDQPTWVACAACLGRHHQACWAEAGSCSACGAEERLEPARPREGAPRLSVVEGSDSWQLLGGPTRLVLERTFVGEATIDDAAWLQAEIRRATGLKGRVALDGRRLVWRPAQDDCRLAGLVVSSLTARGGRTTLRLEEDLRGAAGGLAGAVLGGGMGLVSAILGISQLADGLLLMPLFVVALLLVGRALFRRHARRREWILERLVERLTRGLTWSPPSPAPRRRGSGGPDPKEAVE